MVSFGVGLGQFLQGAQQSYEGASRLRTTIEDGLTERKMRKVEKAGRAEADTAREADISKGITSAIDPATGQNTYKVGDADYGFDGAAAHDAAAKQVGSFSDYYMKTAVPKLVDGYMRAGKPQMAQQYQAWMDSDGAKQGLKHWATAARAAHRGDTGQFIKSMTAAYNTKGYYDDGVDVTGGEEIKDKDGNVTGIRMNFKGADGKAYSQEYHGMEDVYRDGVMVMSPENVFQSGMADVKSAEAARAEAAKARRDYGYDIGKQTNKGIIDDRLAGNDHVRALALAAVKHTYTMEEDNNSAAVRSAYGLDVKPTTEEDVRKGLEGIAKSLRETDLKFGKLSPEEQSERVVQEYQRQQSGARGLMQGGSNAVGGAPSLY